ncbi:hypothetical protein Dsin_007429 [Dipteronia sinensis]|uniref:Uncharacterized protein n=1 Tax=Dipteronia sinensis TaxID=43782 RepID=A0AAE0B0I3_9ROSI|nr:hypothetical protein Dsin_007429 [Dipteronia sinensis]
MMTIKKAESLFKPQLTPTEPPSIINCMDDNGQLNLKSKADSKKDTKKSFVRVYLKTTEVTQLSSNDEIIVPLKETKDTPQMEEDELQCSQTTKDLASPSLYLKGRSIFIFFRALAILKL